MALNKFHYEEDYDAIMALAKTSPYFVTADVMNILKCEKDVAFHRLSLCVKKGWIYRVRHGFYSLDKFAVIINAKMNKSTKCTPHELSSVFNAIVRKGIKERHALSRI